MSLESNIIKIEKGFNIFGSLPGISVVSGVLRATMGKVQLVAGAAFMLFALLVSAASRGQESDKWFGRAKAGANHVLHGVANIFRGLGECALGATIVGSLIPLTIQLIRPKGFNPVLKY